MFVEFCPNGDLTGAIKKGFSELQALKYFRQMVEGMCYMNAKGICCKYFRKNASGLET